MSRGPGRAQRAVLDAVAGAVEDGTPQWVSVDAVVRGARPTTSERESVRRAIRTLATAGTVDAAYVLEDGRRRLAARQPLSDDQRLAEAQQRADTLAHVARRLGTETAYNAPVDAAREVDRLRR